MATDEIIGLLGKARSKHKGDCGCCTIKDTYIDLALAKLKEQPCPTCGGSKKCPVCKGTGADPKEGGLKMCWNCGGSGKCPDCKGKK